MSTRTHLALRLSVVITVSLIVGCWSLVANPYEQPTARDFTWALDTALDLLEGRDPYAFEPSPLRIPYPLPVAVFGFPPLFLRPDIAGAAFVALGAGMIAFGSFKARRWWFLGVLLSLPVWQAVTWCQWSPLIATSWFFPLLGPLLVLIKPQSALPIVLARGVDRRGVAAAASVLLVSLMLYPLWPLRWVQSLGQYEALLPLLQPGGWLLLLAVLAWRQPQGRLVLFLAVMPFRAPYDLVPWFLVARGPLQMLLLVVVSWVWIGNGAPLFLAALALVLLPQVRSLAERASGALETRLGQSL